MFGILVTQGERRKLETPGRDDNTADCFFFNLCVDFFCCMLFAFYTTLHSINPFILSCLLSSKLLFLPKWIIPDIGGCLVKSVISNSGNHGRGGGLVSGWWKRPAESWTMPMPILCKTNLENIQPQRWHAEKAIPSMPRRWPCWKIKGHHRRHETGQRGQKSKSGRKRLLCCTLQRRWKKMREKTRGPIGWSLILCWLRPKMQK